MSSRGALIVGAFTAGLLCAGLTSPTLLVLAALGLWGVRHPARWVPAAPAAALLLLFTAGAVWGGFWMPDRPEGKEGLWNPHYRPLVRPLPVERGERAGQGEEGEEERARLHPLHPLPARPGASPSVRSLLAAVLLNRRDGMDPGWTRAFRTSGTSHLLAVSGLHVGILLALFLGVLRLLPLGPGSRAAAVTGALIAYILAIGAPPSAVRAGAMGSVAVWALALRRRIAPGNLLPSALLLALFLWPPLAFSTGFQLSASALTGIGLALEGFETDRLSRSGGGAEAFLRISLGAQVGVLPVQIAVFGTLHPVAPAVNLAAVPLVGLWLPAELVAMAAHLIWAPAGALLAGPAELLGRGLLALVAGAASLPGAVRPLPAWALWPASGTLLAWARGGRWRLVALLLLGLTVWSPLAGGGGARVVFLDVGQGDATVVEYGSPRRFVVVDGGPAWREWDAGASVVVPYLASRGCRRVELLVATHPDGDHTSGLEAVAEAFEVGTFVRGTWSPGDRSGALRFRERLLRSGVREAVAESGDLFQLDEGVRLEVLGGSVTGSRGRGLDANGRSLVLRLDLRGLTVLLPGDLEMEAEYRLEPFRSRLGSQVLKVAHHGSDDATSAALISSTAPRLAVISAGRGNRYGHPGTKLLARLSAAGVPLHRTDVRGALVLSP
ncbi:MAG: DNA internalization-related competence protein ComEC/Rec2 [bacterium]